jgi:hypothetical protein
MRYPSNVICAKEIEVFMKIWNSALVAPLIFCFGICIGAQEPQTWLSNNLDQLIETIMPVRPHDTGDFPHSVRWELKARIYDPGVDPLMITLNKDYSGNIEASSIQVRNESLSIQVSKIISTNPEMSIPDVANRIELVHVKLDGSKCPALGILAEEYENLSIKAVLPDELMMHSTKYFILTEVQWGNRVQMLYRGAGPEAPIQEVPAINWLERLRELVISDCK